MMKKVIWALIVALCVYANRSAAQTVSFNFTLTPVSVSGWTNVSGDPATAIRSVTASGITVSSMATTPNWAALNGSCAFNGGGASGGTFFPAAVMANQWFQYSNFYALYTAGNPQLEVSGLNKDTVYTVKMTGSNTNVNFSSNPTRFTVMGVVNYGNADINEDNNTANGAVFHNIAPDASGKIHIYVNTYGGSTVAGISGLQLTVERTAGIAPTVAITHPTNNNIIPEDGDITISATAMETGGSIRKVEFFADTVKIGEDSTAPYGMTWIGADPGTYALKARAVDGFGNTSTATITITVQSLNYFWSTTGNIATGADSSFVGTVDTNRLAFRTNNIERMNISKTGAVTIASRLADSTNHPALRVYSNGDLAASTTMDRSVNTNDQTGMRYNAKSGILQIGASDRLDTSINRIAYGIWPTSGLIINSDEPNTIKGRLMNTVLAGTTNFIDSGWRTENAFIGMENGHFNGKSDLSFIRSWVGGYDNTFSATVESAMITGGGNIISKTLAAGNFTGFANVTADTTYAVLLGGANNQVGGIGQFVAGQYNINRTPSGAVLGNGSVDFSSLPWTGLRGMNVPNIDKYPLFSVGNSASNTAATKSNALTILYNGRTQISTAGFTNALTQTDVTPKAALDVVSTNTGVLLPRLTNAQRNAIVTGDLQNGLLLYNTDSSAFQFYNGTAWNSVGTGAGGGGRWLFNAGLQYDSLDNIGIGTSQLPQGYRLAVKGAAVFTKVQVLPIASWPDYVFKKGYRLRSLQELEAYISKYKHLPEMVSAATVAASGVDVGANQAALLKKVEELTLYLIDENKQLKEQNTQLSEQSKKMENLQQQIDELKSLLQKK